MSGVSTGTAIMVAGGLAAAGAVGGSMIAGDAAESAAEAQAAATGDANRIQYQEWKQNRQDVQDNLLTTVNWLNAMYPQVEESIRSGEDVIPDILSREQQARGELTSGQQSAESMLQPYAGVGTEATNRLLGLMNDPSSITQDPGYQFQLDEGTKALQRSAAARGGLYSGATGKAMERYAQDYASTGYGNAMTRYAGLMSQGQGAASAIAAGRSGLGSGLAGLTTSTGQDVAGRKTAIDNASTNALTNYMNSVASAQMGTTPQLTSTNTNYANATGNNLLAAGNAQAAGYINQANATNAGISGVTNAANTGVSNYLLMNYLNGGAGAGLNSVSSSAPAVSYDYGAARYAMQGYAEGGQARAGVPIVVGEEGPEIMIPQTNAMIIPNPATQARMGGRKAQPRNYLIEMIRGDNGTYRAAAA